MGILLPPVSQVTNTRINMTQHHRNRSLDSALQRIPEVSRKSVKKPANFKVHILRIIFNAWLPPFSLLSLFVCCRSKFPRRTPSQKILSQTAMETMPQTQITHLKLGTTKRSSLKTQKHQRRRKVQNQSHCQQQAATVVVERMKSKTNQVIRLSSCQSRLTRCGFFPRSFRHYTFVLLLLFHRMKVNFPQVLIE